jgi:hypothetical protein
MGKLFVLVLIVSMINSCEESTVISKPSDPVEKLPNGDYEVTITLVEEDCYWSPYSEILTITITATDSTIIFNRLEGTYSDGDATIIQSYCYEAYWGCDRCWEIIYELEFEGIHEFQGTKHVHYDQTVQCNTDPELPAYSCEIVYNLSGVLKD